MFFSRKIKKISIKYELNINHLEELIASNPNIFDFPKLDQTLLAKLKEKSNIRVKKKYPISEEIIKEVFIFFVSLIKKNKYYFPDLNYLVSVDNYLFRLNVLKNKLDFFPEFSINELKPIYKASEPEIYFSGKFALPIMDWWNVFNYKEKFYR